MPKTKKRVPKEQFILVGEGGGGLKVSDLEDSGSRWAKAGLDVWRGTVFSNSLFLDVLSENRVGPKTSGEIDPFDLKVPGSLATQNSEILGRYPNKVLAIRSSAFGERGGIGAYGTEFFVPTGDLENDSETLALAEMMVYASAFGEDARAQREKHPAEVGMGLLVQPVIGHWFGDHFMPVLAGSGYTSYRHRRVIRVVPGLGSMAVDDDAPVFEGELPTPDAIKRRLEEVYLIDGINKSGAVERIPPPPQLMKAITAQPIIDLWGALDKLDTSQGDLYFEWAVKGPVGEQKVSIIQSAPYEDKHVEPVDLTCVGGKLIAEGADIVNHGRREGNCVILVKNLYWTEEAKRRLTQLNREHSGHLLIVPQEASSAANKGLRMQLAQISNAAGVLEDVYEISETIGDVTQALHSLGITAVSHRDRAGTHFQQICDREDILFLGASVRCILSGAKKVYPEGVEVHEIDFVMANDPASGKGRVYLKNYRGM